MFTETKELNNKVSIPMLGLGVFRMENADAAESVRYALENGYRHIDTATIYDNEAAVGQGIKKSGVKREEIFVTTKLWNDDMRSGKVKEAFENSLSLLGVDYVDLYLIHWPVAGKFTDSYLVLEELYRAGKIRAIGVSNFNPHHIDELMQKATIVPAVNQVELHPQLSQRDLLDFCTGKGIALQAYAPFGGQGAPILKVPKICEIAEKIGKTPAQVALKWNIQRGVIVIPKSIKPERIKSNADLEFTLSDSDMQAISALNSDKRYNSDPETFTF